MYLGVIIASVLIYFNTIWALIGIPVFLSGAIGYCGIYQLLGINRAKAV